jgi:flagella basal body P-ring formation protein FlgA
MVRFKAFVKRVVVVIGLIAAALGTGIWMPVMADINTIEVRILPESVVYGEYYVLGDIAELDGFDLEVIQQLAQVQVGKSPLPGRSHLITKAQVENRIRHQVGDKTLKLVHPARVMISRAALKITGEQLQKIILEEARKHYAEYKDIQIDVRTQLQDIFIPKGNASYEIKRIGDDLRIGGYSSWMLSLKLDDKEVRKLLIRLKVQVFEDVVVARDRIPRGSQIGENDIQQIRKDISGKQPGFTSDPDLVVGEFARRDISRNETIDPKLVEKPIIINRGARVKLVYRTPNLYLSNLALAMRDGREGDLIPFRTLDSQKTIYAVIRDANVAEIML